jgi:hypothetical protein
METINMFPASWSSSKSKNTAAIWLHAHDMRWARLAYWQMRKAGMDGWSARCTVLRLLQLGRYSKTALDWQRSKREREYRNSVMRDAF